MRTRAAVAAGKGEPLTVTELELDEPRADEARVRMVASGVCHTDAIVRDQWYPTPLPAVLGHEGAGIVESVGAAVTGIAPGDHVLLSFDYCGHCNNCISGAPAYCAEQFQRLFGGGRVCDGSRAFMADDGAPVSSHFFGQSSFAAYSNVRERSLVKVPENAPLELLAPLGCGIQTGAGAVLNVMKPGPTSSLVVFGAGAVGCSALLAAVVAGCSTIVAVEVVPERLAFARELGATHTLDGRDADVIGKIKEITQGGAQFAIETTGVPAVFRQMTEALAGHGHGVLLGAAALGTTAQIDIGSLLPAGITISMVVEGGSVPQVFLAQLVKLYQEGRFPFDRLVKHYRLEQINEAFADSAAGRTIKPVVVF